MAAAKKTDALFLWIEEREQQQAAPWGRVLDAGTGRHSLHWLSGLARREPRPFSSLVAVTGEPALAAALEREFPMPAGLPLRVAAGNWQDDAFLADEAQFDVIVADYLVGAVEGFAPFYQEQVCERLRKLLKPGGRMYMIGLQPLSESTSPTGSTETEKKAGELIQEMARTRDACILLAGRRCYREFPLTWYQRQLRLAGLVESGSIKLANVYTRETIQRQLKVGRNQLVLFKDEELAKVVGKTLDDLDARVGVCLNGTKVRFGFDFVVAASLPK